ncbi:hypothetical protein TSOC_004039 [Tetrabaena socialis]|uniref:Uncharacterized protein n=1 Tax=Tetrabaena socialis TaxID=47790 RepID=A0A2J8A9Z8_9CHLO|nr:hypothetical protein TSOC_004039 [Tetrabaena socialis]|eukprot:PNH09340.1 hypothetical protein TSOC_004039 [Tetrabaena socialis]
MSSYRLYVNWWSEVALPEAERAGAPQSAAARAVFQSRTLLLVGWHQQDWLVAPIGLFDIKRAAWITGLCRPSLVTETG